MRKGSKRALSSSTDHVEVGSIVKPHGIRGDVVVYVLSDDPDRFAVGSKLTTDRGIPLTVSQVRPKTPNELIVSFQEIDDRDEAEELRGASLRIPRSWRRQLAANEYWPDSLIGLSVVDSSGEYLGHVVDVEMGAQDRLVIEVPDGSRVEVPFVDELVPEVGLAEGRVTIRPINGLFS